MEIHSIGINYIHKNGLVIDRPGGSGDNLLIIFKTPAFVTLNGKIISVAPDSAIMFSKGSSQLYGNANELYRNHCIHLLCEEDTELCKKAGLEFDMIFSIYNIDKIENLMKDISYEFYSGGENGKEMAELLLSVLIYKLGQNFIDYKNGKKYTSKISHELLLKDLRSKIYSNPADNYSVEKLASEVNISKEHFQRIYKMLFGISSYEDVICARINLAEYYLRTTDKKANEISILCGYDCYEHFMRQFKKKTGITPNEYRKLFV